MAKLTKKQKDALTKFDVNNSYTLSDASSLIKDITYTKFDASVDLDVRLGVDPKKSRPNGAWYCDASSRYR